MSTSTPITVFPDETALAVALAGEIADGIAAAAAEGRTYVLGCPGGRSPKPVYAALAAEIRQRRLGLGHLVIAMMDEYVVADGPEAGSQPRGYANVDPSAAFSCARFGREVIVGQLAEAGTGTPELWLPDARDPQVHEDRIAERGIDLFILASGSGDGHVAFNSPGAPADSRTRVVPLPESTRRDNVRTHPDFGSWQNTPSFGVTVGIATITQYSARAVLLAHGAEKRVAAAHLAAAQQYDPSWPSTVVHDCRRPSLYFDEAAAPAQPA